MTYLLRNFWILAFAVCLFPGQASLAQPAKTIGKALGETAESASQSSKLVKHSDNLVPNSRVVKQSLPTPPPAVKSKQIKADERAFTQQVRETYAPGKFASKKTPRVAAKKAPEIETPYGLAVQSQKAAALAARKQVQEGAILYRVGTMGKSHAGDAQFWALESPLSLGYANRYGIPSSNVLKADFIETATLKPGTDFITRLAPAVGNNVGGGIEVVVPKNGVILKAFSAGGL